MNLHDLFANTYNPQNLGAASQYRNQQQNTINSAQAQQYILFNFTVSYPKQPTTVVQPLISKTDRIKEIEAELDICRGIVPTPKGYTVNTGKVKQLMAELRELKQDGS